MKAKANTTREQSNEKSMEVGDPRITEMEEQEEKEKKKKRKKNTCKFTAFPWQISYNSLQLNIV